MSDAEQVVEERGRPDEPEELNQGGEKEETDPLKDLGNKNHSVLPPAEKEMISMSVVEDDIRKCQHNITLAIIDLQKIRNVSNIIISVAVLLTYTI